MGLNHLLGKHTQPKPANDSGPVLTRGQVLGEYHAMIQRLNRACPAGWSGLSDEWPIIDEGDSQFMRALNSGDFRAAQRAIQNQEAVCLRIFQGFTT